MRLLTYGLWLDEQIGALLDSYDAEFVKSVGIESYTVLYFASPHEPPRSYESEFVDAAPMELRRSLEGAVLERADGGKSNSTVPLFVKYQFFTPGKLLMRVPTWKCCCCADRNRHRALHGFPRFPGHVCYALCGFVGGGESAGLVWSF